MEISGQHKVLLSLKKAILYLELSHMFALRIDTETAAKLFQISKVVALKCDFESKSASRFVGRKLSVN